MKSRPLPTVILLLLAAITAGAPQASVVAPSPKGTTPMTHKATGAFEVKVKPLPQDEKVPGVAVGRMSIEKEWKGDLTGTSRGEMTAVGGAVKGSGGYVAVEYMDVTLKGRKGTFILMHHATMRNNGDFKMLINVVPDSGTGELEGLSGNLTIVIDGKNHTYTFDYSLPEH